MPPYGSRPAMSPRRDSHCSIAVWRNWRHSPGIRQTGISAAVLNMGHPLYPAKPFRERGSWFLAETDTFSAVVESEIQSVWVAASCRECLSLTSRW
jgi:hypothetical protein